jgi:hypothetical protein
VDNSCLKIVFDLDKCYPYLKHLVVDLGVGPLQFPFCEVDVLLRLPDVHNHLISLVALTTNAGEKYLLYIVFSKLGITAQ